VPVIAAVNVFISKLFVYGIIRSEFGKALRLDLEREQEGSSDVTYYSDFKLAANLYLGIECLMVLIYILYWWREADKKIKTSKRTDEQSGLTESLLSDHERTNKGNKDEHLRTLLDKFDDSHYRGEPIVIKDIT
jgi:hypothetical protein